MSVRTGTSARGTALTAVARTAIGMWLRPRNLPAAGRWELFAIHGSEQGISVKSQEMLRQQFEFFYFSAVENLQDLSREQSLIRPEVGGNAANWILGHVVNVQNAVMALLGVASVWEDDSLRDVTTDPSTLPADGLDWETMKAKLFDSRSRCLEALGEMDDARLDEPVDGPFGDPMPRGEVLALLSFHQAYHVGQFGISRRLAGKPGAIKAPGQQD